MSKGLRQMQQAVQLFRDLEAELPTQTVVCFLLIANADADIPMRDLQSAMDTTSASATRNVAHLSEHYKPRVPGLGLVEAYEDLNDRRYKLVRLTAKGKSFRTRLNSIMG